VAAWVTAIYDNMVQWLREGWQCFHGLQLTIKEQIFVKISRD
jgi:hypothetical protein